MVEQELIERMQAALIEQRTQLRREIVEQGADPDGNDVSFVDDAGFSDRSHSTQERSRLISVVEALRANLAEVEAGARPDRRRNVRFVRALREADRSRAPGGAARGGAVHRLQAEAVIR